MQRLGAKKAQLQKLEQSCKERDVYHDHCIVFSFEFKTYSNQASRLHSESTVMVMKETYAVSLDGFNSLDSYIKMLDALDLQFVASEFLVFAILYTPEKEPISVGHDEVSQFKQFLLKHGLISAPSSMCVVL